MAKPGSERIQKEKQKARQERDEPEEVVADRTKADTLNEDMDEILDEIDSVLEENAQEFIAGYVQKGGE